MSGPMVPYIMTGVDASAELMNTLYQGLDDAVNTVTNGKSMFFLNVAGTQGAGGTAGGWGYGLTPERYYGYLADITGGGYMSDPSWLPNFTFGTDSSDSRPGGTIKISDRQFWFISGAKSGDCDPNDTDNDNREHCVGREWNIPRRIDSSEDIGWYWKLYGRHYAYLSMYTWTEFYQPPVYKHELYDRMIKDVRIFQFNTGKKTTAVLEYGLKTSDFGRFPNIWTNPFLGNAERQRIPFVGGGWSLGHEFDNSLQVPKIVGIKSLIKYDMFTPTDIGDIVAGSKQDPHPGNDPGLGNITNPSGPSGVPSNTPEPSNPTHESYQQSSEMFAWSGLSKIVEKPDRAKYFHEKENYITDEDRTLFYETCDTNRHHVLCNQTSKDELKRLMGNWDKLNPNRTGLAGFCADPYSCWMAASKYWFWEELKTAVAGLYTSDQTVEFTYSFCREDTPIQAPEGWTDGLSTDATAADWNGTTEGWVSPGHWNGGSANPYNPSGQGTSFAHFKSDVAEAFSYWKTLIEETYQNYGQGCALPGHDLTVNFTDLGIESAGADAYGLNDSLGTDGDGKPLLEKSSLNIGRIRFASAKTGEWLNGQTSTSIVYAYSNFPHVQDPYTFSETNLAQDGNIVINPNNNWKKDSTVNTATWGEAGGTNPNLEVSIAKVVAHEIGHSLGFGHSSSNKCDSIMAPSYIYGESLAGDWPDGFNSLTDGKCVEEMYGEVAGPICFEGYGITSFDLNLHWTQAGAQPEHMDEFLRYPWYAPTVGGPTQPGAGEPMEPKIPPNVIVENWPQIENRFEVAEFIFDGYETCSSCGTDHHGEGTFEGYKNYTLSNKFDKYKFFRIHNLNNYDMTLQFEAATESSEIGAGYMYAECSPGGGHTIQIPKHESRCVRRDFGEYTDGFNHFQKFIKGDHRYAVELSENFKSYPSYYGFWGKDWTKFRYNHTNNIVNPFLIDRIITGLGDRIIQEEGAYGRIWDSNNVYAEDLKVDDHSRSGFDSLGNLIADPVGSMRVPTYTNHYRDPELDPNYNWELWDKDTILADAIYHTGYVVQNFLMTSGWEWPALLQQSRTFVSGPSGQMDTTGHYYGGGPEVMGDRPFSGITRYCLHKKLVPYSGAKYIYKFLQDLNVNVVNINPGGAWGAERTYATGWNYGLSGLFVGHTGFVSPYTIVQDWEAADSAGEVPTPTSFADTVSLSKGVDTVDTLLHSARYPKGGNWPSSEANKPAEDGFQWVIGLDAAGWDGSNLMKTKPTPLNDPVTSRDRTALQWPSNQPSKGNDWDSVETGKCCSGMSDGIRDEWGTDGSRTNIFNDPFAYSIHQYNMTTNILGTNHMQSAMGQLYPSYWEAGGRCCVDCPAGCDTAAGIGGMARYYSNIDFINHQDHKFGNVWYGKKPVTGYLQTGGLYRVGTKTSSQPSNLYAKIYQYYEAGKRGQNNYKYYGMMYSLQAMPSNVFFHRQSNYDIVMGGWGLSGAGVSLEVINTGNRIMADEVRITGEAGAERYFLNYAKLTGPSREYFYYDKPKSYLNLGQYVTPDPGQYGNHRRVYLDGNIKDIYDPITFASYQDQDMDFNPCYNCQSLLEADWPYFRVDTHHIPNLVRGGVLDHNLGTPTIDFVSERWIPFHYRHDHKNHIDAVGSESRYGVWGQSNRNFRSGPIEHERFGSKVAEGVGAKNANKAINIWEGRRDFFETTIGDVDQTLFEFNRVDGIWTGFQHTTGIDSTHGLWESEQLNTYTPKGGSLSDAQGTQYLPSGWAKRNHESSYLSDAEHKSKHGHVMSHAYFWNKYYSGQILIDAYKHLAHPLQYNRGHAGAFNEGQWADYGHPAEWELVQRVTPPAQVCNSLDYANSPEYVDGIPEGYDEFGVSTSALNKFSPGRGDEEWEKAHGIKSYIQQMLDNARASINNDELFNFNAYDAANRGDLPNARYFYGPYGAVHYSYQKNINLVYKTSPDVNKGVYFAWNNPQHIHMRSSKDYNRTHDQETFHPEHLFLAGDMYGRGGKSPVLYSTRTDKLTAQKNTPGDGNYPTVGLGSMGRINNHHAFATRDGRQGLDHLAGGRILIPPRAWMGDDGSYRFDVSLGIVPHNYNSYWQCTTRAGEQTSRRAAAMGITSNFFRGWSKVGVNAGGPPDFDSTLKPHSQELFHFSGLWHLHPEIYSNPLRRGNVYARCSGKYGQGEFTSDTYTKKRIGYHKEYGAIDVPYRPDGDHLFLSTNVCGSGPTLVELDKHYNEFGPPAEVHVHTGHTVIKGSAPTGEPGLLPEAGELYWPACNWIFPEVLGHETRLSYTKYCPNIIFRKKTDANCGDPDPRTALETLGADELIPTGVPIIGCSTCYVAGGRQGSAASTDCCEDEEFGKDPYNDPNLKKIWANSNNDYKVVGIQITGALNRQGEFIPLDDLPDGYASKDSTGPGTLLNDLRIEVHPPKEWPTSAASFPTIPAIHAEVKCEPYTGAAATKVDSAHANGDNPQYYWWHGPFPYHNSKSYVNDTSSLGCDFSECPGEDCQFDENYIRTDPDELFDWDKMSGRGAEITNLSKITHHTGVCCHEGMGYTVEGSSLSEGSSRFYMNDEPMQSYVYWGMHWGCGGSDAVKDAMDSTEVGGVTPGGFSNQEIDSTHWPPYNTRNPAFYEYRDCENQGGCS